MTVHKQYPIRNYETFADREDNSSQLGGDADKSRSAAAEARRLASQGSWGDSFTGRTPATDRTPVASTVDGDEVRDVRYPNLSQGDDPSDPPPVYTPSVSTQVASQSPAAPASPVTARSVPAIPGPVSAPHTDPSPSIQTPPQSSFRDIYEEEGPSTLPETVQHQHSDHHRHRQDEETDLDTLPVFLQQHGRHKRMWCRGSRKHRSCGGRRHGFGQHGRDKHRARRIKKTCFFLLMLLACLLLLIPGLCKSLKNDGRSQLPSFGPNPSKPSEKPWPPPKREHREHEGSRSISGTYQLYDLLDLSSTSGSINVYIEIQPGEKPAILRLASTSGSVNVRMTSGGGLFKRPTISETARVRVLQTEISSEAGSVSGNVIHGNGGSTSISTNAGSISLDIYTVGVTETDPHSRLSTTSKQGSQNIRVRSDFSNVEPVRAIEANHTVHGSGSMNIAYPSQWEGMVHLTAYGSGSLSASGRDLVVRKESSHEIYGYKGQTEGRTVEISELGSGSVRFSC